VISAPLIQAVIEMIVFLGTSGDQVVDPDAAVSQLELVASILGEMSESERRDFVTFVGEMAEVEELQSGNTPRAAFLRSLCSNLGLEEE
jgi:hypothetical protein